LTTIMTIAARAAPRAVDREYWPTFSCFADSN
jgi:hypothetical protein